MGVGATVYIELAAACFMDLRRRRIPNKMILLFLAINMGFSMQKDIRNCISGMLFPFILLPLYAGNVLGAGDIKLYSVTGAILGGRNIVEYLEISLTAGAIISLVRMTAQGSLRIRMQHLFHFIYRRLHGEICGYREKDDPAAVFPFTTAMLLGYLYMDRIKGILL